MTVAHRFPNDEEDPDWVMGQDEEDGDSGNEEGDDERAEETL